MDSTKNIIQNINKAEFFDTVDLHLHTNCSDGKDSPQQMVDFAFQKGYKLVSITDHNTYDAYENLETPDGLTVIKGIEFDCWYHYTLLHLIGYGFDSDNRKLNKLCAKNKIATELDLVRFFNRRNAKEVISAIKDAGGLAILAHPACCWNLNLKNMVKKLAKFGLDGVEAYYPYRRHRGIIKFYSNDYVEKIADSLGLIKTGGSDSHSKSAIF